MKAFKQFFSTLLLTTLITIAPAQADDTLQDLIDKVLNNYGGENTWKQTTSIYQEGNTFSQALHQLGRTIRSFNYPHQALIEIRYDSGDSESRLLNGDKVWDHGKSGSQPFMLATRLQSYRLALPKQLAEKRREAKDLGSRSDEDGKNHRGIELGYDHGLKLILDIDADSGHILSTWGLMSMGGQTMQFATFYDDFRIVDGRLIAFKEEHYAMGNFTGHTEIEKVEFNKKFSKETFEPK
jgi:hypothetical protein